MPDGWERDNGLDPTDPSDAWSDEDGDGLLAVEECQLGTDPQNWDSDEDGYSDGEQKKGVMRHFLTNATGALIIHHAPYPSRRIRERRLPRDGQRRLAAEQPARFRFALF